MTALELAKREGYAAVIAGDRWHGHETWEPIPDSSGCADVGYPFFIIMDGNDPRWSTIEETYERMGLENL